MSYLLASLISGTESKAVRACISVTRDTLWPWSFVKTYVAMKFVDDDDDDDGRQPANARN